MRDTDSVVILAIAVLSVIALVLPTLTAVGARRRGVPVPVAVLAGICFPVTWTVWYVRDERPHHRANRQA